MPPPPDRGADAGLCSRLEPMTDAWLAVFAEELADVDTAVGSAAVQVIGTTGSRRTAAYQVFDAGVLIEWGCGEHRDPDLVLVFPLDAAARFASGQAHPGDIVAATIAATPDPGACLWAIPPLDEQAVDGGSPRRVPCADATVELRVLESPFAPFSYSLEFREGRRTALRLGPAPDASVSLPLTFEGLLRYRIGESALAEALADGAQGRGEWPELMLAAGLLDRPEYVDAVRAAAPPRRALEAFGVLAEIMTSPNYVSALERARARLA